MVKTDESDRITREELMKYLQTVSSLSREDQEIMADTFSQYDRAIQNEFIRSLKSESEENSGKNKFN